MKKSKKKLVLRTETIQLLTSRDLERVVGGEQTNTNASDSCHCGTQKVYGTCS
jgi:hypothetical protein